MTTERSTSLRGFTIVELLIVIVVIGVLAAIVIVAYNGITSSANDVSLKADMASVAKKLDAYKAVNGSYPAQSTTPLDAAGLKVNTGMYMENRNNFYYCLSTDTFHYSIGIDATNNTEYYIVDGTPTLVANGSVNGANTCAYLTAAGYANGGAASVGHSWDGTTGTWALWTY